MLAVDRGIDPRWITESAPEVGDAIIALLEARYRAEHEQATRAELRKLIGVT